MLLYNFYRLGRFFEYMVCLKGLTVCFFEGMVIKYFTEVLIILTLFI